jgi:hypothetical protein
MDWLIGAVLVFLVTVGVALALIWSRPNHRRCLHCGAELKVVAGRKTPICQVCGREQPWTDKQLTGHGLH